MFEKFFLLFAFVCTVSAELGCPDGWTLGKGTDKCYKLLAGLMDYDKSEAACKAFSAELPSIHSDAENAAVYAYTANGAHVRLGAKRSGPGKYDFKWNDGSPMDYKRFNDQYMDNTAGKEDCFDLWLEDRWNDIHCTAQEIVVCQKPGSHVSSG
ncbi:unnamed protein product, partial [Mesorhabditis spiculigera]